MVPGILVRFRLFDNQFAVRPIWLILLPSLIGVTTLPPMADRQGRDWLLSWALSSLLILAGVCASILFHEVGHATAARRAHSRSSRVTLYPFGGVAEGFDEPSSPGREAAVASGGPAASLLALAALAICWLAIRGHPGTVTDTLLVLVWANAALAACNILPGFPFDGGRAFRALVWYLHDDYITGTKAAVVYGQLITVVSLMVGIYLLAGDVDQSDIGLWVLVLSWTANRLGQGELARSFLVERGSRLSARDTVLGLNPHVRAGQSIDEVLDVLLAEMHVAAALVMEDQRVIGIVSLDQVRRYRRSEWNQHTARDAMIPVELLPQIPDSVSVRDVLSQLASTGVPWILVAGLDGIIGVLDRSTAIRCLYERSREQERGRPRRS